VDKQINDFINKRIEPFGVRVSLEIKKAISEYIELVERQRDEARRLFREAMEYADSVEPYGNWGRDDKPHGILHTKPRPVAPWEGEK
jgi:hypothetical protein